MSVSGVAHARRASFQQSAENDWNRMNQVAAEVPRGHSCVRNHTQTHIHIHTSSSHTKAGIKGGLEGQHAHGEH